jgi:lysophospholipase L1-like esterase/tetratricopeptide (TPR) repeat protein
MRKLKDPKKVFFYTFVVVLPYLLIAVLELTLRIFSYGNDLSLFIPSADSRYCEINHHVGERFFSKLEYTTPLSERFLKEKPANGYRIFVLGESTVQGFPYEANIAFSKIIQRRLQDIFPDRVVEVVNLGLTAVNSYTLLDFADELLDQKPDVVLIYAGHNEYYGALGVASMESGSIPHWLKKLQLKFVRFRSYQLLQKSIGNIYKLFHPVTSDEAKATLMEKMVGRNLIPYHSEMYSDGLAVFADNMSELLGKMNNQHVPVLISDLVSNVRDLPPFRSLRYKNFPPADSLYVDARQLDSNHVFDKARDEYVRAKDLDVIRFRASEDINSIIAHLADSLGAYPVSLKTLFEKYSPNGMVGDNLMTDHLHPNVDGYFLMAEGFLTALRDHGMPEKNWDSTRVQPWTYYRYNWGFTELDSMIAAIRIKHLKAGWPFQPEATVNSFRATYTPKGIIDSLAFMCVKYVDVNSSMVHKKLAAYYESIGDFRHASKEYFSLAYISPLNVSSYYYAADLAFKAEEYSNAIRYLKESPYSDTSSYVQFTLATIYSSQKNNREALSSIERLQNLHLDKNNYLQVQKLKYKILTDSGLANEAEKTLAHIKELEPSFNTADGGKSLVVLIPSTIRPFIEKAETLRKNGRSSEALSVLKEANTIREIPYTNLLIGKILFSQKKMEAIGYLEKAKKELRGDPSLEYCLCLLYLIKQDYPRAKSALENLEKYLGQHHPQVQQLKSMYEERRKRK